MEIPWYIKNYKSVNTVRDLSDKMVGGMTNNTPINFNMMDKIRAAYTSDSFKDSGFEKGMTDYLQQKIKANAGWSRDDTGNFSADRSTKVFDQQQKMLETMGASSGASKYPIHSAMRSGVTQGMTSGAEQMVKESPIKNLGWGLAKKMESWAPKSITEAMKNPYIFWGSVAAGAIGLAGLVRSFLSSREQPREIRPVPSQFSPSTSFWRT